MRLLNVLTLELKNFHENQIPPYIILSHTWGDDGDEVTLQEMIAGSATTKRGYKKITDFCKTVIKRNPYIAWIWVDTCCIDKTSSSELSEAINSMFRWYKNCQICYAYLEDVLDDHDLTNVRNSSSDFASARWFTRAWCLQELIAPRNMDFFGSGWNYIGKRHELSMKIAQVTGIDQTLLGRGGKDLGSFSIAQRMSWASKRTATREEDLAYCLLGIFGVNMPLIYGEGANAFIRLQEEIIANFDDQSLLAWTAEEDPITSLQPSLNIIRQRGVLARSPANFKHAARLVHHRAATGEPFTMTNKGLRIRLPVLNRYGLEFAILNCHFEGDVGGPIGIQI